MQLSRLGITHLRYNFALGGRIKSRCSDWKVTELDLSLVPASVGYPSQDSLSTSAAVSNDHLLTLLTSYGTPPSFDFPIPFDLISDFSKSAISDRTSLLLFSLPVTTPTPTLRALRGFLLRQMAPALGAARIRRGRNSYDVFISRNPIFTEKLMALGLSREDVAKVVLFSNAGLGQSFVRVLADRCQVQAVTEAIQTWDSKIVVDSSPQAMDGYLDVGEYMGESIDELGGTDKVGLCLTWARDSRIPNYALSDIPLYRFALEKENMDLPSLLAKAERGLGLPKGAIGFAGIKDKRGVTTQWLTAPKVRSIEEIESVFTKLGGKVGGFEDWNKPNKLRPGELGGNIFQVIVRWPKGSEPSPTKKEVINKLKSETFRFTNYFGVQRFGYPLPDGSSKHVLVGASMLRRRWDFALRAILSSDSFMWNYLEKDKLRDFDHYVQNGQWRDALRVSRSFGDEGYMRSNILAELVRGADAKDALRIAVPKTLLHLYPASVISLLWNAKAAEIVTAADLTADEDIPLEQLGAESEEAALAEYQQVASAYGLDDVLGCDLDLSDELGFVCRMTRVKRPVLVKPRDMQAEFGDEGELKLSFGLPPGSYASALLLEVMEKTENLFVKANK